MLIRRQTTYLLQIFCEILLYSQVIFKSMRVPDNTFWRMSKCEWVNANMILKLFHFSVLVSHVYYGG